jgi:hypothetical protein
MLQAFVNAHRDDWDEYLNYVLFAYRTSVHHSTHYKMNVSGRKVTALRALQNLNTYLSLLIIILHVAEQKRT